MPPLEGAEAFLMWTLDEGTDRARRGHAYVFNEGTHLRWISLEHSPATTPTMLEALARWEAAHLPTPAQKQSRRMSWAEPTRRWRFHGDLGAISKLLESERALVVEHALDIDPRAAHEAPHHGLPALPEAFLRRPIATMVAHALGSLRWPVELEAPEVCVGPGGIASASEDDHLVVCAARPGSVHDDAGQTRTAAVWCSHDAGASWTELGWSLDPSPRDTNTARHCWPPEQILRVRIVDGAPVIEWDDPWMDWEPGTRWLGVWVASNHAWSMRAR